MQLYMLPAPPLNYMRHCRFSDHKSFGDSPQAKSPAPQRSYFQNFLFGKNRSNVLLAARAVSIVLTSLIYHVGEIILSSAEKKMIRAYAGRIVASVKDVQSFWDLSIVNEPRSAMGERPFTRFETKFSIPPVVYGRRPRPASFALCDFLEKSDISCSFH